MAEAEAVVEVLKYLLQTIQYLLKLLEEQEVKEIEEEMVVLGVE